MAKKIYTKKDIYESLEAMGAERKGIVIMHTSLRSVGAIEGGGAALLDVMVDYFTSHGGLFCVPTHTWHNLDKEITLDMDSSDTCLGVFSNLVAGDKRGVRTENPTHSMVIFGDRERAEAFAAAERDVDTPTSPHGCYGKLSDMGGKILLVGVGQIKNTFIHSVEEKLGVKNRLEDTPTVYKVKRSTGEIIKRGIKLFYTDYTEDISYRFHKYELAFRYHGAIVDGFIGDAPTQLCDARKIEETVRLIYTHSHGIDPLASEEMLSPTLYANKD